MNKLLLLLCVLPLLFTGCTKDDEDPDNNYIAEAANAYIVNYGSYSSTEGSLTALDTVSSKVYNNAYFISNDGVKMSGKPQYAYEYEGNYYFMGNAKDEIFFINKNTLIQTKNGVSENIVKPRFCVGNGDYLYISCYGGDVWTDKTTSYIAKYNIKTNSVEKKIALAGGPEGLTIVNEKLYCALNYDKKIAIMDLESETFTFIETEAVSSYFLTDNNNNLYVSFVSTYSDSSEETGIGYINTTTNTLETTYKLPSVWTGYSSVMSANKDFSKIYIIASDYSSPGSVQVFNTSTKSFDSPFVTDITGINAISVNPKNDDVYIMISQSTTSTGQLQIYNKNGELKTSYETGIAPAWVLYK